ncbi:unnamed protein product [Rotaria sordida]|uniref:small monomeric GTPase n=1 Tax=Rotaria sordida TaxID=392033 RepID=A0A819PE44_9BILA|nr:unnamed protein product [Rotaria sordida]CAF4012129.1 unnamed protein product [Rotaria sordida]
MNITYEKNVYYSFFIFILHNPAQFDDCFCSSILSLNIPTRNIASHLLSYRSSIKSADIIYHLVWSIMSHEKFTDTIRKTGNNVAKLEKLQKKYESEYDETSKAVQELEEGPQTETTTSEINRLKQRQVNQKIQIRVTGLKAEKVADDRDAILGKDCRLHNKCGTILILGFKNSGKKTLMNTLKENKFDEYTSNLSCDFKELIMGKMKFTIIDLDDGGCLWKKYIETADAIIFLIDSTDSIRFPKAKEAFHLLLNDKQILNKPLIIIGTKSDLPTGLDEEDLAEELGVTYNTSKQDTYGHLSNLKLYLSNMKDMASFACVFRFIATFLKET